MLSKFFDYQKQKLEPPSDAFTLSCFNCPAGYMEKYIEVENNPNTRVGYTSNMITVEKDKQMILHLNPGEIKVDIQYKERFKVLEDFRSLVADPLKSPAYLWGQVDEVIKSKSKKEVLKYPEQGVNYVRNIILLYHIGLQL